MTKLSLVLCLTLVVYHFTSAQGIWPFGQRPSSLKQDQYSNSQIPVGSQVETLLTDQYYSNAGEQLPIGNSAELTDQQAQAVEHKDANYGTKGIAGFINRHKTSQQTQPIFWLSNYGGQNDLLSEGYIDTQSSSDTTSNTSTRNTRPKPTWKWVFLSPTTQSVNGPLESVQQTQPQKRPWLYRVFHPRSDYTTNPVQSQCQCLPQQNIPYLNEQPTYAQPSPAEQVPQSNVRLVQPTEDSTGLASNINGHYLSPLQPQPVQSVAPVQIANIASPVQQQNQVSQVPHLDLAVPNESPIQSAGTQQLIFPNTSGSSTNTNSNVQPSVGDNIPNSQNHAIN